MNSYLDGAQSEQRDGAINNNNNTSHVSIRCPPSEDLTEIGGGPGAAEKGEGTSGSSEAAEGSPWDSPPSSGVRQAGQEKRFRHTEICSTALGCVWGAAGGCHSSFFHGNHRVTGLFQTARLSLWEPSRWERMDVRRKAQGVPAGWGRRGDAAGAQGSRCQGRAEGEARKGEVRNWHLRLFFWFVSSSLPFHRSTERCRKCRHPETNPSKRHK